MSGCVEVVQVDGVVVGRNSARYLGHPLALLLGCETLLDLLAEGRGWVHIEVVPGLIRW